MGVCTIVVRRVEMIGVCKEIFFGTLGMYRGAR